MVTKFAQVHEYSRQAAGGRARVIREHHYVRLAHGLEVVYIQDGYLQFEDGTPLTPEQAIAWQDDVARLGHDARRSVGLDIDEQTMPVVAPPQKTVWLYGPEEHENIYITHGGFYWEDGRPLDTEDLPEWARLELGRLPNHQRARVGLLPVSSAEVQSEEMQCPDCQGTFQSTLFETHQRTCPALRQRRKA